jgi:hypothetical protein
MNRREKQEVAQEFLRELGRGIPDNERCMVGYAEEATVQTDATGKKLNSGWFPQPHRDGRHVRDDENCYVCISSSIKTPNPRTGTLRYWRGEASFGHGLALMVDDIGNGKGSKGGMSVEQLSTVLEPTAVVETSPGNFQCWYFFEQPESDMRRFKAFLVGFVETVLMGAGGDTTIRDISRYGRLPVGINNKRTSDGAFKYPDAASPGGVCNVRLCTADYTRRYGMDQIALQFGYRVDDFIPAKRSFTPEEIDDKNEENRFNLLWLKGAIYILGQAQAGEGSSGEVTENMSGKYRIKCPWGDEHTNGDPYGAYFRARIPGAEYDFVFGCAHDTCRKLNKRTWTPFVDKVVMPFIENRLQKVNADSAWADEIVAGFVKTTQKG